MTWADRMRAEGRTEGCEEGALNAKRAVLLDLVRTRFGEIPSALATQTTQMLRRAVTAARLEELLN